MASKRKVNLDDYQLTTTLGTGKKNISIEYYNKRLTKSAKLAIIVNNSYLFIMLSTYRILW